MTFISNLSPWPPLLPAPPYGINWGLQLVTAPVVEPLSVTELKNQGRIEITDDDWTVLPRYLRAARHQFEHDTNRSLVARTMNLVMDACPLRSIPILVPRPPLQSVLSIVTIDTDGNQTTMDPTTYLVDGVSEPGRIGLVDTAIWPQNLRSFQPITVQHIAGYTGQARGGGIATLTQVAGTATATTSASHGLATGQQVTIAGATQAGYNGTFEIVVTSAMVFTYQVASGTASPATTTTALTVIDLGVPDQALEAILLLAAHYYENREASIVSDKRITVQDLPIGYDELISTMRVHAIG